MRIISLVRDEHYPERVEQWFGDSIGFWDGDTLVVTTSNIKYEEYQGYFGVFYNALVDENLEITERFTRIDSETISYQARIEDPTIFTAPWTIELCLTPQEGPILEYACHEGNIGLSNILSGARFEESQSNQQ